MLEALFDIKAAVYDLTTCSSNRRRKTMKKRRKLTPEEWRAEKARREDLDRRMLEMIERLRKSNAEKRAAAEIPRGGARGAAEATPRVRVMSDFSRTPGLRWSGNTMVTAPRSFEGRAVPPASLGHRVHDR